MMRRRFMNNSNSVPLSFEALEDGLSISFSNEILYRINGGDWKTLLAGENTEEVNKGSVVSFRHAKSIFVSGVGRFSINKKCNVYGTCSSIIPKILGEKYMAYRLFSELFYNCDAIVDASKLELPATTLADSCYESMFFKCTSLVNAPELPATTLADSCYSSMFSNCTSLVNAPELPATTLADSCYSSMFYGCTKLNYIKAMFMTTPSTDYTNGWVYGVSPTGTFVKSKDATWDTTPGALGYNGVPAGWTVKTDDEESGGNSLFPATLIPTNEENLPNYNTAKYFLDNYPDMVVDINGSYTPITEDVTIEGSNYSDGKVVGVAKWSTDENYQAVLFYTENSIGNLFGLRVFVQYDSLPQGAAREWFFD